MYKVIWNDKVIDVLDCPRYVRYIRKANKFTLTDRSSAQGVYSSTNNSIYTLQGKQTPATLPNKKVQLVEISEREGLRLRENLCRGHIILSNISDLRKAQQNKIEEMSEACSKAIVDGIDVRLSDNRIHHFKLTIEDQINLHELHNAVETGCESVVYHEDGQICREFSKEDFAKLYEQANKHKRYHTTYFNILKSCIINIEDIELVSNIKYGDSLTKFNVDKQSLELIERI